MSGAVVYIPLTQGKVAVIDFDDLEKVRPYKWCVAQRGSNNYAVGWVKGKLVLLHRFLLETPPKMVTDHLDGNGLNNQRANLRACSNKENSQAFKRKRADRTTTSKFIGVWRLKGRWRARISESGKGYHLGYFDSQEDAARAYDQKALELFGEFAQLNFPKQKAE